MSLPFPLPAWLPWWALLIAVVLAGLWLLAMLVMPFGVFGLKARLERVEARLDEIQNEIRNLAFRLPEPDASQPMPRPPVPPASGPRTPAMRAEPRLEWPR